MIWEIKKQEQRNGNIKMPTLTRAEEVKQMLGEGKPRRWKCSVCGYIFDEAAEGKRYEELEFCPFCHQPKERMTLLEREETPENQGRASSEAQTVLEGQMAPKGQMAPEGDLSYDSRFARRDENCRYMAEIHEMAVTGKSIHAAMGTRMPMPSWDEILILGAQLNPMLLDDGDFVSTTTVIGKNAKRPMVLESPVYVSHMSFGALSAEAKTALAKGSAYARTAMCSGEGGILPQERENAYRYILSMYQTCIV